jgi:cytochrome c biogenesis protein CcmG/thiol:disulfide interchange protein DsbE
MGSALVQKALEPADFVIFNWVEYGGYMRNKKRRFEGARSMVERTAVCWAITMALCWQSSARAEEALQMALSNLEGGVFSLEEELKKGPVVFDLWATWCKPCIKALPKIQEVADAYREHGVGVFTINVDGPRNQAKIRPFIKRYKLHLPVLLDKTNEVAKQFQLVAIPSTLVISSAGEVVYKHQGYRPGDEEVLKAVLDTLIKKERAAKIIGEGDV